MMTRGPGDPDWKNDPNDPLTRRPSDPVPSLLTIHMSTLQLTWVDVFWAARTKWAADNATWDARLSAAVIDMHQLMLLLMLFMMMMLIDVLLVITVSVMSLLLIAIITARSSPTVTVWVATVRWTVLLVYQVLDERHDWLGFAWHRLNTIITQWSHKSQDSQRLASNSCSDATSLFTAVNEHSQWNSATHTKTADVHV